MSELRIAVNGYDNPYRDVITNYLSREFPANLDNKDTVLEAVTAALIASSKVRFGPLPSPENLVAIRKVLASAIEDSRPIPLLMPWGSKKPSNTTIDIAELGGLKTLVALQKRVQQYYTPGIRLNMRVEDTTGNFLFADEGKAALQSSREYVQDFCRLIRILNMDFVNIKLESYMMDEGEFLRLANEYRPIFMQYLTESDAYGIGDRTIQLNSFRTLQQSGWQSTVPQEQRDFYRHGYAKFDANLTPQEQNYKLATYFASVLARVKLKAYGAEEWEYNFVHLSFAPPVPGLPKNLAERRVYYRTLPESMARTHIPPWRAHGYIRVCGDQTCLKIGSWADKLDLIESYATFSRAGQSVDVRVDQSIAD